MSERRAKLSDGGCNVRQELDRGTIPVMDDAFDSILPAGDSKRESLVFIPDHNLVVVGFLGDLDPRVGPSRRPCMSDP